VIQKINDSEVSFWSPEIDGNQLYKDIEKEIVEECKLDYNEYLDKKDILTGELFREHLDNIVIIVIRKDIPIGFQTIGKLTLQTKARIPSYILNEIIKHTFWKFEEEREWKIGDVIKRKRYLRELRESLLNYKRDERDKVYS